ncbi:MAG: AAA family ATPase [Gammaproteobacteria bacterium]
MYISRIHLRNWKNFKDIETKLGQRVFVIGPNASGKSNLLDAFRFLRDVADKGLKIAVDDIRGGVSLIRCLAATRYSNVDIEIELSVGEKLLWKYKLEFNQDKAQRPSVRSEIVFNQSTEVFSAKELSVQTDPLLSTQTALEQISLNRKFRDIADFFKTISYQHLLPQVVRDPRSFSPIPVQDDPYGRDFLLRVLRTPERTRESRLQKISRALKTAIPQLTELKAEMDKSGVPHLIGRYEHWRPNDAFQTENQFSDGTLRLFGMLWTTFEGTGPLLIEEPEISLHPEIVRRLPMIFYKINRERKEARQIVISTHSDDLLSDPGIAADEVIRLQPSKNGTQIAIHQESDKKSIEAGLTVGDVLLPRAAPSGIEQLSMAFDE